MRISADKNHPDYHASASICRVWLAGAERKNVITADEEGRFAVQYRLDEFGKPVWDKDHTHILTDPFYGDARIECPDWLRTECEARAKLASPEYFAIGVILP